MKSLHLGQYVVALRALIVMTVITGALYPLLVFGIGQVAFPSQAKGSLIYANGKLVGSSLLGQDFSSSSKYFQSRPSAAGQNGYDPTASGGTNLALDSDTLVTSIKKAQAAISAADGVPVSAIPADAVTSSASGLDPDISPAYAAIQVDAVAAARGLSVDVVKKLVAEHTSGRSLGILGEPTVNVLQLNLALDALQK